MNKTSKSNLSKVEQLFKELGYVLRYEKGNFQSGYCLVENRKIIVVNKFFDTEARINVLLDILSMTLVMEEVLSEKTLAFYKTILKTELNPTLTK